MNVQPKKSSRLFILLGVALTFLSMIGVYFIASSHTKSTTPQGSVSVVVAAQVVPVHTIFASAADASEWFTTEKLPANTVPPQSFSTVAQLESTFLKHGKYFNQGSILPKEIILRQMFTGLGGHANVTSAYSLPKDDVAVSLNADIEDESGGAISVGDYVDIVSSYTGGGGSGGADIVKGNPPPATQTQFVLQDIKVVAVGTWTPGSTESTSSVASSGSTMLTFACSRNTALIIQHLKDFAGSWITSVMLRSAYSNHQYKTSPINGNYFFNHLKNDFQH